MHPGRAFHTATGMQLHPTHCSPTHAPRDAPEPLRGIVPCACIDLPYTRTIPPLVHKYEYTIESGTHG